MKIVNHRLVRDDGTPYPFRDTPNKGGAIKPRWLVMHYTAGGSAQESITWLADKRSKASAHVVIAKDGSITQMVDFNRRAWHAGASKWRGVKGLNSASIGIELDGFGFLGGAGPGRWRFRNTVIPDAQVLVARHRFGTPNGGWATYPRTQLDVALELAKLLIRTYGLEEVIGHDDISPGRKQDPGPAFDMAAFRVGAMGPSRPDAGMPVPVGRAGGARFRVTATLNVRSGPGASNPTVAGSPLAEGTFVRALQDQGGWKQVTAEGSAVAGWVSARFLEPAPQALFTVATTLNVRTGPGAAKATVPGSPLPEGTIVEGLADEGSWKRVAVQGAVDGSAGVVGWVSARFLQPAVIPVGPIAQPQDA